MVQKKGTYMSQVSKLTDGVRRRLAGAIVPKEKPDLEFEKSVYYPQQPTCQIPNLWMLYTRFLGENEGGYFVEVGAYDGIFVSNTWGLAERKWGGLMIEPVPHLAEFCRENHRSHPGVQIVEVGVGSVDSGELNLHIAGTLTTANVGVFSEYADIAWASPSLSSQIIRVGSDTLNLILRNHNVPVGFDVLVVDVEGYETHVFSGFSMTEWKPKMMIVELADTHPDLNATATADAHLGSAIIDAGYRIVFKDSINTVFIRQDIWETAYQEY